MALLQESIDKTVDQLEQLTSRERMLVLVGSVAGLLLIGYIFSLWFNSSLNEIESNNQALERKLEEISRNQTKFDRAKQKVQRIKRRIANNRVDLSTFVSQQSQKFAISIESMNFINPRSEGAEKRDKDVLEKSVRIEMKATPLANLAKFLDSLENSGKIVKVRQLRMNPNFSNPEKIDVTATISTYSLKK